MSRFKRKAILAISGQVGAILISITTLRIVLHVFGQDGSWVLGAMFAIALIRLGYHLTRGPRPLLAVYAIRKRLWRLVVDETRITGAFAAAIFIMAWPVGRTSMAVYAAANLFGQTALMSISIVALRLLARHLRASRGQTFDRKVIIIGTGQRALRVADMILDSPELETKLLGFLDYFRTGLWRYRDMPLLGRPDALRKMICERQIDAVFIAVESEELPRTRDVFDTAERMGIPVCLMPDIYDHTISTVKPMYVNGLPALVYRAVPDNQVTLALKGIIDRIGAVVGIVLFAPIMLVTALAVKLEGEGPVLYRQRRCGLNGRPFTLYKFRTMCHGAEKKKAELLRQNEMSGPVFKLKNDPRVTGIGRILRKYSIDELPQFFNVLKGEMSLVGPRPPLPLEVAEFEPWQWRKLSVKPGVTCMWQVNGRNHIDFDDWMRLDLHYIDHWSLWLDAKIMARTVPTMMKGTGM